MTNLGNPASVAITITHRRICWPNPDAVCLAGGCVYCNDHLFIALPVVENYARSIDAYKAYRYGELREWFNVEVRSDLTNRVKPAKLAL